jgi:hypothetical protein
MRAIYYVMGILAALIGSQMCRGDRRAWALCGVCLIVGMGLTGCRVYHVYMMPCGDATITVDAAVEKQISPQVKATVTP